jgi:hypothetical protein
MSGPEHFVLAEKLAEQAMGQDTAIEVVDRLIAKAQVHATLALAAASAYPAVREYVGVEATDAAMWAQVTT